MTYAASIEGETSPSPTHRLRDTWPIHKRQSLQFAIVYVVLTGAFVGIGFLITGPLNDSAIVDNDRSLAQSFADGRTPAWNDASFIGSMLAETAVKVVVTLVIALALLWKLKRWREPLVIVVALVLEASTFITVTFLVGRQRPDVARLDTSPVGSSFPSGHVAAAVAYTAIAVVVFWLTRNRLLRLTIVMLCVAIPVIVALARMYRGMHYLTDVGFGALLGLLSVVATVLILRPAPPASPDTSITPTESGDPHGRLRRA